MKKVFLLTGLVSLFLLQGCMKVETTANINDAGKASMTMLVDMSQMASMQESMMSGATSEESSSLEDFCTENEMSEQTYQKYQNVTCKKISDYVFQMTYTADMAKYMKKSDSAGSYAINIQTLLKDSQESINQETSANQTDEEKENSLQMAESMGFVVTMTINFSGNIISSDVGKIKGKTLTIDLFADGENIAAHKETWVKIKGTLLTNTGDLQKAKYEKLAAALGKRLTKSQGIQGMQKIDAMITSASKEKLQQMLNIYQVSKRKNTMTTYMEAKIWLFLNK